MRGFFLRRTAVLLAFVCCLGGCSGKNKQAAKDAAESEKTQQEGNTQSPQEEDTASDILSEADLRQSMKLGIFLPCAENEGEWKYDAAGLSGRLKDEDYRPVIYYADHDQEKQNRQIAARIRTGADLIVVCPEDPLALTETLSEAKISDIPVFSYGRMVRNTDAPTLHFSFDMRGAGQMTGQEIADRMGLSADPEKAGKPGEKPHTIEFYMGKADGPEGLFYYEGMMEILRPCMEAGSLEIRSGNDDFSSCLSNGESVEQWLDSLKENGYRAAELPEVIVTADEDSVLELVRILEERGIRPGSAGWPMITCAVTSEEIIEKTASARIAFCMFFDRRSLAAVSCDAILQQLKGEEIEITDYSQFDNGVRLLRAITVPAVLIDKDNYRLVEDNGYYSSADQALRLFG